MKPFKQFAIGVALVIAMLFTASPVAQAQTTQSITIPSVPASTTSNYVSGVMIPHGFPGGTGTGQQPFGIWAVSQNSPAVSAFTNGTIVFTFHYSLDGSTTNIDTGTGFTITNTLASAAAGSNAVRTLTYMQATNFYGSQGLVLTSVNNNNTNVLTGATLYFNTAQ